MIGRPVRSRMLPAIVRYYKKQAIGRSMIIIDRLRDAVPIRGIGHPKGNSKIGNVKAGTIIMRSIVNDLGSPLGNDRRVIGKNDA